jgi:2-iminobutanoate/2-iminopropanoate deaminase
MTKEFIKTHGAPQPAGPFSQGIRVGNFVFVSGQGPKDPKTGKMPAEDIETQTLQSLQNVKSILEAAGFSLRDVVKVSVFLKNAGDFQEMNEVYGKFFPEGQPTRTTVEVKFVAAGMLIEIDAVAYRE